MDYLVRGRDKRQDSRLPVPGTVSAIVVAMSYGGREPSGPVARYARGDDYHDVMLDRLQSLHRWLEEKILAVGADKVATCSLIPGSEDFSHYLEHKPGSFLRLGNGVNSAMLHSAKYDFADESLTVGAAMWARLTERYLDA